MAAASAITMAVTRMKTEIPVSSGLLRIPGRRLQYQNQNTAEKPRFSQGAKTAEDQQAAPKPIWVSTIPAGLGPASETGLKAAAAAAEPEQP